MAGWNRISQHDVFIVCVPPKFHCLIYLNRHCYSYLLKCSARAENIVNRVQDKAHTHLVSASMTNPNGFRTTGLKLRMPFHESNSNKREPLAPNTCIRTAWNEILRLNFILFRVCTSIYVYEAALHSHAHKKWSGLAKKCAERYSPFKWLVHYYLRCKYCALCTLWPESLRDAIQSP